MITLEIISCCGMCIGLTIIKRKYLLNIILCFPRITFHGDLSCDGNFVLLRSEKVSPKVDEFNNNAKM